MTGADRTDTAHPAPGARPTGERLRELTVQLSLLNHRIAARLGLQDIDLYCIDIISRTGPLTPSALARAAGLHPATTTGVLDRLERAGWIRRERSETDRRAVRVSFQAERADQITGLYRPVMGAIGKICEEFGDDELAAIDAFLDRCTEAGREATDRLGQ